MSIDAYLIGRLLSGPWEKAGIIEYRIERAGPVVTLLFRCTDRSVTRWINNLSFPPVVYKRSKTKWRAHGGFVRAWRNARDEIMSKVYDADILYISGHSRGAVFAELAHEDYGYKTGSDAITWTFGGPRFLWLSPHVCKRFDGVIRVVNHGDIVPHLPPFLWGFHHAGIRLRVGNWCLPKSEKHTLQSYSEAISG